MSSASPAHSQKSVTSQKTHSASNTKVPVVDEFGTEPDFIFGGPFITQEKPSPFLDTATPINLQLQGTFKK